MASFPSTFDETTRPLPLEELGPASRQAAEKLAEQGYEVHYGLTPEYAEQIREMSQEPAIREYCPKDCDMRFRDRPATEKWLTKQRSMFLLLQRRDDGRLSLAGYGWVG